MSDPVAVNPPVPTQASAAGEGAGLLLVFLSAFVWSTGGAIARFIDVQDVWTVVFWRSLFACLFLLAFLIARDGPRGAVDQFRTMGWAGLVVGLCFTSASVCFVLAIAHTTVANVMLMNGGVPLLAALFGWVLFRTRVTRATWFAIAAVLAGVLIMVSSSLEGRISPVGDLLAMTVAVSFAMATVFTRQFSGVRMTSALCVGTAVACLVAASLASGFAVSAKNLALLFGFGALNLGLGMALFAMGARLVPASLAALIGTFETVAGPIWVWLIHGEVAPVRTIVGGAIVFSALIVHVGFQFTPRRLPKPGVGGLPTPH